MWIRDGKNSDPGWKKVGSGIWDKNLGSATLVVIGIPPGENLTLFLSFLVITVCIITFSKLLENHRMHN
jgi:hypothetical protein